MNFTSRGKTYLLFAVLSFAFSYLITSFQFFPSLGMALTLITFALISYKYKTHKTKSTNIYLFFTLIFAVFLVVRCEPFITLINFAGTLFFGALMLTSGQRKDNGVISHIFSPLSLIFKSLFTKSQYFWEYSQKSGTTVTRKKTNTIFGISISLVILIIVLPLLSSANPIFQKLVMDVIKFFSLDNLISSLGFETIFIWSWRLVFFFIFLICIPKIITLIAKDEDFSISQILKFDDLSFVIPKIVISGVLIIFFITQFELYFANQTELVKLGLSYSQHAREVFAQLSIVATIVMLLLYNSHKNSNEKRLNWLLIIQGIFLTFMAYKSAFDYINAWGLTYVRLYGVSFATWITGIFVLYSFNLWTNKSLISFVKNSFLFTGVILILINISNFDFLIYHYKKATTGQGIDYTYLSRLSADSLSYKDNLDKLHAATENKTYFTSDYNNIRPFDLLNKIDILKTKYSKLDIRTFNLLEYFQYLQIRDEDTKSLYEFYGNLRRN
jgi:hypothetical protein